MDELKQCQKQLEEGLITEEEFWIKVANVSAQELEKLAAVSSSSWNDLIVEGKLAV